MECSRHMEDGFPEPSLPYTTLVFDDTHDFGRPNMVFDADTFGGHEPVEVPLNDMKFLPFGLLYGLDSSPIPSITLIPGVLHDHRGRREEILSVCNALVVGLAAECGAYEYDGAQKGRDDAILDGVFLLLSTVTLLLKFGITGSGNLPFRTVVKQNTQNLRVQIPISGLEFLHCRSRHVSGLAQGLGQDFVKGMYPEVTVPLLHSEMVGKGSLGHVILQEIAYEPHSFLNARKRTVLVDHWGTHSPARFSSELVVAEILVVGIAEIREQFIEVLDINSYESPESLGVGVGIGVTHDNRTDGRAVHALTRIIKNLNNN